MWFLMTEHIKWGGFVYQKPSIFDKNSQNLRVAFGPPLGKRISILTLVKLVLKSYWYIYWPQGISLHRQKDSVLWFCIYHIGQSYGRFIISVSWRCAHENFNWTLSRQDYFLRHFKFWRRLISRTAPSPTIEISTLRYIHVW